MLTPHDLPQWSPMKVLTDLCPWPTFDYYARPFWCSLLIKRLMSLWICRNKHWKDGKKQVFNFVYLQKNVLLTGYSLPWRLDIPTNKSWIGREHSVHDISQAISHVTFGSSKTVRRLCSSSAKWFYHWITGYQPHSLCAGAAVVLTYLRLLAFALGLSHPFLCWKPKLPFCDFQTA